MSSLFKAIPLSRLRRVLGQRPSHTSRLHDSAEIVVRDRRFNHEARDTGGAPVRFWHAAGKAVSVYFDNLSVFFPVGERFFIQAVKAHQHAAPEGSELRSAVKAFYAQEAYHGREHRAYNARLAALGYPVAAMEAQITRLLAQVTRLTSTRFHLAVTAALEHFTAMMGYHLLSTPELIKGSDPELTALWLWHAVEENEHKAVAFDLFKAAGGTRLEQSSAMLAAALIFWLMVVQQQVRMMRAAGFAADWQQWRDLARFMFIEPGNLAQMPRWVVEYLRPGFHPNDLDSSAVIAAWREAAGELSAAKEA